jgi:hypothetical protein
MVRPQETAIYEAPHLDLAQFRICVDTFRIKRLASDHPLHFWRQTEFGLSAKGEGPCAHREGGLQGLEVRQHARHDAVISLGSHDIEAHDRPQRGVC